MKLNHRSLIYDESKQKNLFNFKVFKIGKNEENSKMVSVISGTL